MNLNRNDLEVSQRYTEIWAVLFIRGENWYFGVEVQEFDVEEQDLPMTVTASTYTPARTSTTGREFV